jgi:hypothetical protein
LLYSDFAQRKALHLSRGENVATENCALDDDQRRIVMHVSPTLAMYLKEQEIELRRYLVHLDVDIEEIRRRCEAMGRGQDYGGYITLLEQHWRKPGDLSDDYGGVTVLRYENSTESDKQLILKDLGSRLNLTLL